MRPLTAVLGLACVPLLMGCATPEPVIEVRYLRQEVPPHLLACTPEPEPPAEITDDSAARFVVALAQAGAECRGKLEAVRGVVGR